MTWIVMTSTARMPTSVKAPYRNVALVKLTPEYASTGVRPLMISTHARGVLAVEHQGYYHVGRTGRGAFQQALAAAERVAAARNKAERIKAERSATASP